MIKSLELNNFRKHEHLVIDFTKGLNVLRGPNEIGKTTITEGFLYALYGATALIDTLAETVTWGKKESDVKAKLVIAISGIDHVFSRSKAGAECSYAGPDKPVIRVTGQKEVTAFASQLLGADAKTASVMMLSSQAGLRGALEEGPTAISALMGKLADFDMIDRIIANAAATLSLGSEMPATAKLTAAENDVHSAQAALVDPASLAVYDADIISATSQCGAAQASAESLVEVVSKADAARDAASLHNGACQRQRDVVAQQTRALEVERSRLVESQADLAKRPDPLKVAELRAELAKAADHAGIYSAYLTFGRLGAYPAVAWDEPKSTFDSGLTTLRSTLEELQSAAYAKGGEIKVLRSQLVAGDGKCPTCGSVAANHDHVTMRNAETQARIDAILATSEASSKAIASAKEDIAAMEAISKVAESRQKVLNTVAQYITLDETVYPARASWAGEVPDTGSNVPKLQAALDLLDAAERTAAAAGGRAHVYSDNVRTMEASLATATAVSANLIPVDTTALQQAYDAAYADYAVKTSAARDARVIVDQLKGERAQLETKIAAAVASLEVAQRRVIECIADIKKLEFNNELVKRLKSMKPMITDHLWNGVLAAVSNFFSQLRGEQSVVTKDSSGFKVNGRGGSLSGSTLDVLALSIRVALAKTFVPHASFMVLDEPAHGCDEVRTSNLLGFLSGIGFDQTILASHDEMSEAVADNIINLGVAC